MVEPKPPHRSARSPRRLLLITGGLLLAIYAYVTQSQRPVVGKPLVADEAEAAKANEKRVYTGVHYDSMEALENATARGENRNLDFVKGGGKFWDTQPVSDASVAGGTFLLGPDIRDSKAFLDKVLGAKLEAARKEKQRLVALDAAAGVGRVSENLLLPIFSEVDLVDPSGRLLEGAKKRLAGNWWWWDKPFPRSHAPSFHNVPAQQFEMQPHRYDLIWAQWLMLYLRDGDALRFFKRCTEALRPGGLIVVKDNVIGQGVIMDPKDASITRSNASFHDVFRKAGLKVVATDYQRDMPPDYFEIRMWALAPQQVAGAAGAGGSNGGKAGGGKRRLQRLPVG